MIDPKPRLVVYLDTMTVVIPPGYPLADFWPDFWPSIAKYARRHGLEVSAEYSDGVPVERWSP